MYANAKAKRGLRQPAHIIRGRKFAALTPSAQDPYLWENEKRRAGCDLAASTQPCLGELSHAIVLRSGIHCHLLIGNLLRRRHQHGHACPMRRRRGRPGGHNQRGVGIVNHRDIIIDDILVVWRANLRMRRQQLLHDRRLRRRDLFSLWREFAKGMRGHQWGAWLLPLDIMFGNRVRQLDSRRRMSHPGQGGHRQVLASARVRFSVTRIRRMDHLAVVQRRRR